MGFATVVADGELNELISNDVNVVSGQDFTLSAWVRWSGLSYTGTDPIAFGVTEYELMSDGTYQEGLSIDLGTVEDPGTDSSNPSNNDFIQLTGEYTVPEDPLDDPVDGRNVDQIRMRLKIGANLTAGTVDWSDVELVPSGFVRDSAVPGVGQTVDNITNKILGLDDSGWAHTDSANALGEQNNTLKGLALRVITLEARLTTGIYGQDFFSRIDTDLSAFWLESYGSGNGHWETDGHAAVWVSDSPYGSRESIAVIDDDDGGPSTTDYQTIVAILNSAAGYNPTTGQSGFNDVIGRYATNNFIRFRVGGNGAWSLSKTIAGVETVMDSGTTTRLASGSYFGLICGDKASTTPRHYTCFIGGTVITSGVFGDTTSNFGASYRGWGFGGRAEGDLFESTVYAPGGVTTFSAHDTY